MNRGLGFKPLARPWRASEIQRHILRVAKQQTGLSPLLLGTPTILDQGGTGACTGFAAVQCAHISTGAPICSPAFSYYVNRLMGANDPVDITDDGADPDNVDAALNQFGLAPMIDAPFDESRINAKPHDLAFIAAQRVKADLFPILDLGDSLWPTIQHVVSVERKPLFLAIKVTPAYDNSTDTDGFADDPSGAVRGLHAICGYGTSDRGAVTAGSWGTSFGANGSVVLSPAFLAANCVYAASLEIK